MGLCEPRIWFLNKGLKVGKDYEDCLEKGSCEARKPSKAHCPQIRDRETCLTAIDTRENWKSPCGWCFGKHCPGVENLCEPRIWFLNKGLKVGKDYEDCLEKEE